MCETATSIIALVTTIRAHMRLYGHFDIRLKGRCMEPFLIAGDVARITPIKQAIEGDICLIVLGDAVTLHRLVKINGADLLTKGDYSGHVEHIVSSGIVGLATEFCFAGGSRWIEYKSSRDEKTHLAKLSLSLCMLQDCDDSYPLLDASLLNETRNIDSSSHEHRQDIRREIWNLNQSIRARLDGGFLAEKKKLFI